MTEQKPASMAGEVTTASVVTSRSAEHIASEAIETLDRYLSFFYEKGYPGRAALRSGWIREGAIAEDRARVKRLRAELAQQRKART
jgi:hypothetical protein